MVPCAGGVAEWRADRFYGIIQAYSSNNHEVINGVSEQATESPAEQQAWTLLMAARSFTDEVIAESSRNPASAHSSKHVTTGFEFRPADQTVVRHEGSHPDSDIQISPETGWRYSEQLPEEAQHLLELYLPVLATPQQPAFVIAHLGQSIDARIATRSGDAFFVTGDENRKHLHRLRSLCQAVLVGAGTVMADDPQLTTRAVSGDSPVRVIIDPRARIPQQGLKIMEDGQASTWLLHDSTVDISGLPLPPGCRRLSVPAEEGALQPRSIVDVLASHGIRRLFVEGGGVTVSRFFNARCLHRLQIAAAPLLVGEGVPALQIPGAASMLESLRPAYRVYAMGQDVMWDFELGDSFWNDAGGQSRKLTNPAGVPVRRLWSAR